MKTIQFEDEQENSTHTRGEVDCEGCCCGTSVCCECNNGLVHCLTIGEEEIGENNYYWVHAYRCDNCNYECLNEEEDWC